MVKIRNIVYDEKPLLPVVSQEITICAMHERRDSGVGAFKLLHKDHQRATIDVKIDEEDKALILLSSLSQSYDHIITTILYGKKTLILEEVTLTLLSNCWPKGH